ncbi:MAG: hypothetical protein ACPGIC_00555 [Opitutales bacterium]
MIKKLITGIVVLAIIASALIYFLGSSALNQAVKAGIETFGPKVTQTPVTLDSVHLSVLSGSGSLKGLHVGNPNGFRSGNIFELGRIDIAIDTGSILTDTIVIEKIHIIEPGIRYEKKLATSNLKELQKNIEVFTGRPKDDAPKAEKSGSSKTIVIKELVIDKGTIYVGALGIGQTVPLPRIEMKNIGQAGTETNPAEVINEILAKVLTCIGPAIANAGDLGKEAANVFRTQGLEKAGQAAGKAAEAASQAAEGIKNLFGN